MLHVRIVLFAHVTLYTWSFVLAILSRLINVSFGNNPRALLHVLLSFFFVNLGKHFAAFLEELEQLLKGIAMMKELTLRTRDYLVSFGECLSTRIFAAYLNKIGVKARQVCPPSYFSICLVLSGSSIYILFC